MGPEHNNYEREMGAIHSRMQNIENKLEKTDNKIEKVEVAISGQLKDIKTGNDALESKIDDLINKEKYNQGFLKALIILASVFAFGITTYVKMH